MKITFIDNVRDAWRFAVMWVQAFGSSLVATWLLLPDDQKQAVLAFFGVTSEQLLAITAISVMVSTAFARVVKQNLPATQTTGQ